MSVLSKSSISQVLQPAGKSSVLPSTGVGTSAPTSSKEAKSSKNNSAVIETSSPLNIPSKFGTVERGLYRSNIPAPANIPFLSTLGLKTVISLTPELPHPALSAFYSEKGIELVQLGNLHFHLRKEGEWRPISDELVKESLELILSKAGYPIMVMDPSGIHLTGIVIGCLRKLQHWNFASIVVEYRSFTGPSKHRYSDEQYIEVYDTDLVNVPSAAVEWFDDGEDLWRKEEEEEMGDD